MLMKIIVMQEVVLDVTPYDFWLGNHNINTRAFQYTMVLR